MGLRSAIQSSVNEYFADLYVPPRNLNWEQISRGLTMVVGIRHPDPQFESPTKRKLLTPEANGAVRTIAYPLFEPNLTKELQKHFEAIFKAN